MAVQAMLQELCSYFNNKMYRLGPDASTGFCGLHYVERQESCSEKLSPEDSTARFSRTPRRTRGGRARRSGSRILSFRASARSRPSVHARACSCSLAHASLGNAAAESPRVSRSASSHRWRSFKDRFWSRASREHRRVKHQSVQALAGSTRVGGPHT